MSQITANSDLTEIAALVSDRLERAGISAVLSGGAAVSIYSSAAYLSRDLDFITSAPAKNIRNALSSLGFKNDKGRYFTHPKTSYFLEFPAGPLAIGDQIIRDWAKLDTEFGPIHILTPTQCVMDRLAAYYFWNDPQALDQAIMVARGHNIEIEAVYAWSTSEGHEEKYSIFFRQLAKVHP